MVHPRWVATILSSDRSGRQRMRRLKKGIMEVRSEAKLAMVSSPHIMSEALAYPPCSVSLPVAEDETTIALSPSTREASPAPNSSIDPTSASFAQLSDQELAPVRALLEQPSSRLVGSEKERDELGDATYGRVVRGLDNAERAIKAMECGSELWMTIRETTSYLTRWVTAFPNQEPSTTGRKPNARYACSAPEERLIRNFAIPSLSEFVVSLSNLLCYNQLDQHEKSLQHTRASHVERTLS